MWRSNRVPNSNTTTPYRKLKWQWKNRCISYQTCWFSPAMSAPGGVRFCHLLLQIFQTWRHFISNLTSTACCLSIPYSNMLLVHVTSDGYALVGDDPWEHGSSDRSRRFLKHQRMVTFEASLILLYSKQICMDSSTCFEENWNQKQPCNNFFLRFLLNINTNFLQQQRDSSKNRGNSRKRIICSPRRCCI